MIISNKLSWLGTLERSNPKLDFESIKTSWSLSHRQIKVYNFTKAKTIILSVRFSLQYALCARIWRLVKIYIIAFDKIAFISCSCWKYLFPSILKSSKTYSLCWQTFFMTSKVFDFFTALRKFAYPPTDLSNRSVLRAFSALWAVIIEKCIPIICKYKTLAPKITQACFFLSFKFNSLLL